MSQLKLVEGSRASQLFHRLEETFEGFLEQLPPGVAELARQQAAYYGNFNREPFGGLSVLNPVLVSTPWLFWECFQELDDKTLLDIAGAGAFYVLASVVLDHLVDSQASEPGALTIYHQALYSQAASRYRAVFPAASPFWGHFQRLENAHLSGLAAEVYTQSHPAEFTRQTLASIAQGKVSPITTTLVALSIASGRPEWIPALEASLNHIAVASQLLDDIGDWQADFQNRHLTYFLAQLAGAHPWLQAEPPSLEMLEARLLADWTDTINLKQVKQDLDRSLEAAQGLNCPAWQSYVEGYRSLTDEHLERTIKQHLGQVFTGFTR